MRARADHASRWAERTGGQPTTDELLTAATAGLSALGVPRVYSPAEAAAILRQAGLREMTECALRTRAYRKQVPFHLNGRRITFTLSDLTEIAEGQAHRPPPQTEARHRATADPAPPSYATPERHDRAPLAGTKATRRPISAHSRPPVNSRAARYPPD
jgi:hypothetical protein